MKIERIISKNKDNQRMEVIARNPRGLLKTLHIKKTSNGKWFYFSGWYINERTGERRMIFSPIAASI